MSYDIEIRSDNHYSRDIDVATAETCFSRLPSMHMNGSVGYFFESEQYYMELWFEYICRDGEVVNAHKHGTVNCIRATIPYGHMADAPFETTCYFQLCAQIAAFFGWRAYDQQLDQYFDENLA